MFHVFLVILYAEVLLSYVGIRLLDSTVYRIGRGSLLRITIGDYIVALGSLLIWGKILSNVNRSHKNRIADYVWMLAGITYIIFVSQTRMMIISVILAIGSGYIVCRRSKSKKVAVLLMVLLIGVFFVNTPIFKHYFNMNFSSILSGDDTSLIPRMKAISHYIGYGKQRLFMGWGIVNEVKPSNNVYDLFLIFRGEWGTLYTNDVGIFGYFLMYGVTGIILFCVLLYKMLKISFIDKYNEPHRFILLVYIVISSVSLIMFDTLRQSYIPLVLMCFEMSLQSGNEIKWSDKKI